MTRLFYTLFHVQLTEGSYEFEVKVHSYSNPNSRAKNENHCDNDRYGHGCDNIFTFCLRPYGGSRDTNLQDCELGRKETRYFGNSDDMSFENVTSLANSVSNPMVFSEQTSIWPVSAVQSCSL